MKSMTYLIAGVAIMVLAGIVLAMVPPPVDQRMGVYDTLFANFTEGACRGCHTSGVPDRHHMLVPTGEYGCNNCHPVVTINGSQQVTMVRNCMQCHDTTFNGMTIRRPHHETQDAQNRHCSFCHGNLVDDYDDGHYVPTYNISMVTPDTKYKVINSTTGKKWGGCEACHEQNLTMEPLIAFNNKTHHRLGSLSGFNPPNNSKCVQCHDLHSGQFGSDSVRYCERCHATKSLHNIQYDYINTSGTFGSGHIGANWDCNGCHAFWVAGGIAPGTDVIVPNVGRLSTSRVVEGTAKTLSIYGTDFINGNYTSVVAVVDTTGNIATYTPSSITTSQIVVTLPAMSKGDYGIYVLKNGAVKSNKLPFVIVPNVIVNSAVKSGTTITIKGVGLASYDPLYNKWINVTINRGTTYRNVQISNWTDTMIIVTSSNAQSGDIVRVNSVYGTNSTRLTVKK